MSGRGFHLHRLHAHLHFWDLEVTHGKTQTLAYSSRVLVNFPLQSCMTEVQRYGGSQQKPKNPKHPKHEAQPDNQIARVQVPPPAPSPPPAAPPVNVFDFLVPDPSSRDRSPSLSSSSVGSHAAAGQSSISDSGYATVERRPPEARPPKNPVPDEAFSYGEGPIPKSLRKYDSELDWFMKEQNSTASLPPHRTPASQRMLEEDPGSQSHSTDKKRKRQQEDIDMNGSRKHSDNISEQQRILHSGLTGGLGKMLGKSDSRHVEPSPLGPKKRSKVSKKDEGSRTFEDERKHRHRQPEEESHHQRRKKHHENSGETKAIEGRKGLKTTDLPPQSKQSGVKKIYHSHSEFFLSLVDKDHRSHKGQSIWGTLKMFHEGLDADRDGDEASDLDEGAKRDREQRRLLKGLRMKVNKNSQIVLFSRADRERSLSPSRDDNKRPRQIEGPS